ncbi:HAD family hydrolase [Enterobacter quasihormaechei]|uniref:HAD family hydrolase n=1 Tax=Enterobacter quasihormaechei TaxID=2529382 RepID=UPI002F41EB9F
MSRFYNTVFFDFDGTIADTRQASVIATQAAFEQKKLTIPTSEIILSYMGIPIEKSFEAMRTDTSRNIETDDIIACFREIYPSICDTTSNLYDGMSDLLAALKKENFLLAVVTSKKSNVLARNIANLGLSGIFDVIIGSDHVSNYKPHPEPLLLAKHKLSNFMEDDLIGLMIGDAVTDIQMGQAAHMDTCAVTWGAASCDTLSSVSPNFIADNVQQLHSIIWSNNAEVKPSI